jgi:hypothetical protein
MSKVIVKDAPGLDKILLGLQLPTNINGESGRFVEQHLIENGWPINRGKGCDLLPLGLEIKTRKKSSTSPQTIGGMTYNDIINTAYEHSPIYIKFRQQYRIKTNDLDIVVSVGIYNFDQPQIQQLIKQGYEHAREQLRNNSALSATSYNGFYGYFERKLEGGNSFDFRLSNSDMETLERMATSHYSNLFSE